MRYLLRSRGGTSQSLSEQLTSEVTPVNFFFGYLVEYEGFTLPPTGRRSCRTGRGGWPCPTWRVWTACCTPSCRTSPL
uniref:Uncharacterized protein n=1 Tax=Mastacembelus armatus TaxID=205130 RepID=A0A7N9ARM9_9TELE